MKSIVYCTDDFRTPTFPPHGRVQSALEERIFVQIATGPFNAEIVDAMQSIHADALQKLRASGPWGAMFCIEESAMSTYPMLDKLTDYLARQKRAGGSSVGTAIVIGKSVVGAATMIPLYLSAWTKAGVTCQHFETRDAGRSWLQGLLA